MAGRQDVENIRQGAYAMPFREKSAWLMSAALTLVSAGYAAIVINMSQYMERLAPPHIPLIVVYTMALAILATASHVLIAVLAPKDAVAPADERDRAIAARAGAWSGYVFATGVALALGDYLVVHNGDALFYGVFATWIVAQLSQYAFQIVLYRRPA
jgi:hypothetical protein